MIGSDATIGGPPGEPRSADPHPRLTRRWVETALLAGRLAFEREMERDRRELDREFHRFWRAQRTQGV